MKTCPRPDLGGDLLQWERYSKEWNEETPSERNKRGEISSSTLVGPHECVSSDVTGAKHLGEMVFNYICQVVQQAALAMDRATGKIFWQVCQKLL